MNYLFFVINPLIQLTSTLLRFFYKYEFCGKVENSIARVEIIFFIHLKNWKSFLYLKKKTQQFSPRSPSRLSNLAFLDKNCALRWLPYLEVLFPFQMFSIILKPKTWIFSLPREFPKIINPNLNYWCWKQVLI